MTDGNGRTDRQLEVEFEAFLAKLTERDGRNVRSHITACEREETSDHTILWKRLACLLARLAPSAVRTTGQRALQFFASDGDYRIQMFALEDTRDGKLLVYCPDTLEAATAGGVVRGPIRAQGQGMLYEASNVPGAMIEIEVLSAKGTADAPDYYKHLLGWNRRALKITVRTSASAAQVDACEALCRLAAAQALGAKSAAASAPAGTTAAAPASAPSAAT